MIQTGEVITVPLGRTAILANTQIDGDLILDGDMFIPAGSSVDFSNGIKIDGENIVLSIPTAYHLLQGSLSVSNEVITNGFSTTLYTGNGGTQAVNTGIDMSTQHGNDVSETFGGLNWIKNRSSLGDHILSDSVNDGFFIRSNTTTANTSTSGQIVRTSTGVSLGSDGGWNGNAVNYASWNFQTTHRRTGVTNHGKAYTEHYNPFTGFTIIKYEGSGIAGHEIPHSLGRKLGFVTVKNLSVATEFKVFSGTKNYQMILNSTAGNAIDATVFDDAYEDNIIVNTNSTVNTATNQYIMYGWANSYYDESNKLIGNYEVGVYQGTGVAGNKVTTRGKPAWVMIKRLDSTGSWAIFDNQRNSGVSDPILLANLSNTEAIGDYITFNYDSFTLSIGDANTNASGGQYLYMLVYDNDSGSGKSKYPKATDTSNVQINNAIIPLAHGVDSNGSKNSIVVANETITGLTYTQGKNYLHKTDTGYGVKHYKPRYLSSELVRRYAGEQPDYYDVTSNKWFNTDTGSELVSNGTFSSGVTTGWTNNIGHTQVVENGTLKVTSISTAMGQSYQSISTVVGKQYKISFFVSNISMSSYGLYVDDVIVKNTSGAFSGIVEYTFIANSSSTKIGLITNPSASGQIIYFDNISVFPTVITPTTEITESRNYLNHIVHADQNVQVTYVEELPKIEYKDIIKANKYIGSNAVSLSVAFDLTTTPITIKGKIIGAKALIRTSAGVVDIYLDDDLKGIELKLDGITNGNQVRVLAITNDKITIETSNSSGTATSYTYTSINGVGE